jgi:hypothetical protein
MRLRRDPHRPLTNVSVRLHLSDDTPRFVPFSLDIRTHCSVAANVGEYHG